MTRRKIEVGVIGLGKFGLALATALSKLGHSVVGIDVNANNVKRARDLIAQVFEANGTDLHALEQLGVKDLDHVVVSTGESMEASILVVLNLQELGVERIWAKAISKEHENVLKRLGVDFVVFPEDFVAKQLAHRLAVPGLLDYLGLGEDVLSRTIVVDKWRGKSLRELKLTTEYKVQVVAIRPNGNTAYDFVPKADRPLEEADELVILGKAEDVLNVTNT